MGNTPLSFLTVQQIAARWNMDITDVHQLILTGRLSQSFLLSGLATVARYKSDLTKETHPVSQTEPAAVRVLTRGISGTQRSTWTLADVQEVYECNSEGIDRSEDLKGLCIDEGTAASGWLLDFEPDSLQIIGEDSFQQALRALRGSTLISSAAIAEFEAFEYPTSGHRGPEQTPPTAALDTRRQRCRLAVQILWERDPKATVPALYRSDCIQRIACEGRPPTEKTFREWVKDLNPDRSAGRRAA
jgi:hypothetical protein